ncbi:MAG: hypothetical protein PHN69_00790 [Candidatus Pacebacteria bacterium]|nr:hypothetical protein [Candidatus Paceibacterota bacterium]
MSYLKIKNWSEKNKDRIVLFLALFLTILILFLSFGLNILINKYSEESAQITNKENFINLIKDVLKIETNTE